MASNLAVLLALLLGASRGSVALAPLRRSVCNNIGRHLPPTAAVVRSSPSARRGAVSQCASDDGVVDHHGRDGGEDDALLEDRRRIFRRFGLATAAAMFPGSAHADPPSVMPANPLGDNPSDLADGLLESRVTENVLSPPPYGLEGSDIYYPDWFAGVWSVDSVTSEVQAPCGPQLFGGNATLASARKEVGPENALRYRSRFVPGGGGGSSSSSSSGGVVIADREYNVREIVRASMGTNAVVDVSLATPNKLSCVLSPAGAGTLLSAELITLARRQETVDRANFHCSEVVRQIVAPVGGGKPTTSVGGPPQSPGARAAPVLLKEIETASLYSLVGPDRILCRQRSATFLLPSQQDPVAYQLWQMSRGRPIDVRFYDVTYTKVV